MSRFDSLHRPPSGGACSKDKATGTPNSRVESPILSASAKNMGVDNHFADVGN